MKFDNGDEVIQDGRYVTVRVGDIKATRRYMDVWNASRAFVRLQKSPEARLNFFRPVKARDPRSCRFVDGHIGDLDAL